MVIILTNRRARINYKVIYYVNIDRDIIMARICYAPFTHPYQNGNHDGCMNYNNSEQYYHCWKVAYNNIETRIERLIIKY